jgi:hypothetical protein
LPLRLALLALPALLVAACSDPVPPPGSAVSGRVWFDRNTNGIEDACDPGRPGVFPVALYRDGEQAPAYSTQTAPDGSYRIEDVARGEYVVTLAPERDWGVWPITYPQPAPLPENEDRVRIQDRRHGHRIAVDGFHEAEAAPLGVAHSFEIQAPPGRFGLYGITFNDADRNGEVSRDECGVPAMFVHLLAAVDQEVPRSPLVPNPTGLYVVDDLDPAVRLIRVNAVGCGRTIALPEVEGSGLLRANAGLFEPDSRNKLPLSGRAFLDSNGNEVFDEGERPLAGVWVSLQAQPEACITQSFRAAATDEDGTYTLYLEPDVRWYVGWQPGDPAPEQNDRVYRLSDDAPDVVEPGNFPGRLDVPFVEAIPGRIVARLAWDDPPPPEAASPEYGVSVCFEEIGTHQALDIPIQVAAAGIPWRPNVCPPQDARGVYDSGPVFPGSYRISVSSPLLFDRPVLVQMSPPTGKVDVDEGEIAEVTVKLRVVPAAGDSGAGEEGGFPLRGTAEGKRIIAADSYFEYEGRRDPVIVVEAGEPALFYVNNWGRSVHNLHLAALGIEYISTVCGDNPERDPCTDPPIIPPGDTGRITLKLPPGRFEFRCDFHPEIMTGTIVAR